MKKKQKNIVVFVGSLGKSSYEKIMSYIQENKLPWEIQILQPVESTPHKNGIIIDFNSQAEIKKWVGEFGNRLLAVTARSEKNIPLFQKIIPFLPKDLLTPSVESLTKATEKTEMRKAFKKHDPSISPQFKILKNIDTIDIKKIMKGMEFPVIVKPSGLASSLLVQAAHYPEELESILKLIKNKINSVYKNQKGRGNPSILIEEIIEGDIYSIDAYIDNTGKTYFTPFVKYKTSAQKGFDDFSLYERGISTKISEEKQVDAKKVAIEGIKALGLKNTTTHIELVHGEDGWKIIEIGPRIGGHRDTIYALCFNINHTLNDILIRIPRKKPIIKKKKVGYISTILFFPRNEGYITKIQGIKKAKQLKSFYSLKQKLRKGDKSLHAKNGGTDVFNITLFNKDKAQFIEDKRKLEKMVHIETQKVRKKK